MSYKPQTEEELNAEIDACFPHRPNSFTSPRRMARLASGGPMIGQCDLAKLRQAIIDNTKGDGFWIGEILLDVLEKETGFRG